MTLGELLRGHAPEAAKMMVRWSKMSDAADWLSAPRYCPDCGVPEGEFHWASCSHVSGPTHWLAAEMAKCIADIRKVTGVPAHWLAATMTEPTSGCGKNHLLGCLDPGGPCTCVIWPNQGATRPGTIPNPYTQITPPKCDHMLVTINDGICSLCGADVNRERQGRDVARAIGRL